MVLEMHLKPQAYSDGQVFIVESLGQSAGWIDNFYFIEVLDVTADYVRLLRSRSVASIP